MSAGFGVLGGIVRVLVTGLKSLGTIKINKTKFLLYAVVVISIGVFSGIVLGFGKILSFLAGYAGLDLIDGYYNIFKKKAIKFKD